MDIGSQENRVLGLAGSLRGILVTGALLGTAAPVWSSAAYGHPATRDAAKPAAAAPSMGQIRGRLRHTIEIGTRGEYFRPGKPLTIRDGRGTGTLTAVVGVRYPTADGLGQVVFFWHNRTFIGLSASYETIAVVKLRSPGPGTFVIWYAQYRHSDPICCPTLPPRKVTYGWSGRILISNGVPPKGTGTPPRVRYQPDFMTVLLEPALRAGGGTRRGSAGRWRGGDQGSAG